MTAGRPRKPDDLKVVKGTFRSDRDGIACPPVEMPGHPVKPDDLNGEASTFWDRWVPQLVQQGVAKEIDSPELGLMCQWWAESLKAHALVSSTETDDSGYYRAVQLATMADKQFRILADKFGLNPKDRGQLRIQPQEKTSGIRTRKRA